MIIIRKALLIIGLVSGLCLTVRGQSEGDFQKFSEDFFSLVLDTSAIPKMEYTRIKTYNALIDRQDWGPQEKEKMKLELQKSYAAEYAEFHNRLGLIVNRYKKEIEQGATAEFIDYSFDANPKWKDRYTMTTKVMYQFKEMQTLINFEYEVIYSGKALMFIGAELTDHY